MKLYETPAIEITRLYLQDVLTSSVVLPDEPFIDGVGDVELPDEFLDGGAVILPDEGL